MITSRPDDAPVDTAASFAAIFTSQPRLALLSRDSDSTSSPEPQRLVLELLPVVRVPAGTGDGHQAGCEPREFDDSRTVHGGPEVFAELGQRLGHR